MGAYAIAIFRDPQIPPQPFAIPRHRIDKIRERSRAKDDGPWVTDFSAMAMKTAIRGLAKLLPQSPELQQAMDIEDRMEAGEVVMLPGEDTLEPEGAPPEKSGTAAIKAKLAKKK